RPHRVGRNCHSECFATARRSPTTSFQCNELAAKDTRCWPKSWRLFGVTEPSFVNSAAPLHCGMSVAAPAAASQFLWILLNGNRPRKNGNNFSHANRKRAQTQKPRIE